MNAGYTIAISNNLLLLNQLFKLSDVWYSKLQVNKIRFRKSGVVVIPV